MQSLYRTAALLSALDDAKVFQVLAFLQKKAQEPKRHIGMKSFWWNIQFICVFMRCLWNILFYRLTILKIIYLYQSTNIEEISRVNTMVEWSKCTKYDFIPMLKSLPNNSILLKSNWSQRFVHRSTKYTFLTFPACF